MIVSGYSYPTISREILDWWLKRLTWLCNFSYGIRADGSIIDLQDQNMIRAARTAGVRPIMVLTPINETGHFDTTNLVAVFNDPIARANLINNIDEIINRKGLGGINFDVEYLPLEYAQAYVDLIADTQKRLSPQDYLTTVALAPKIRADQPGVLYEGHDYKAMGEAADYCLLMTYEWGYTYGDPQPVSPINNVREVVEYGLTEIPAEKILVGLNNYGYDWTLPFVRGESKAETLGNYEAAARAEYYGVPIEWDERAMAPFFRYISPNQKEHIVWFENERSWQSRISMVEEYGLAGVGIWTVKNIFYGGI